MTPESSLTRFLDAQENDYARALTEIKNGRKQSHWMWYIFPQIAGLGFSETAKFYSIRDLDEAQRYLSHPVLGSRLREISQALLAIEGKTAHQLLGSPDDVKLSSSMTLFGALTPTDPVFQAVLAKYYAGAPDSRTLAILGNGR
ncbi:DUF1810 domain-containing protein [Spirosoma fluviale]|uniref:Uncharacterized protein, DUF1810 family n=1 Tax=Spirosoma fluviale TaxID=1597977 RepID=A0A286GBG5_9BACT|nr:DUF1810 domain-containing protein [Spirosoma fluviale]SOD92863.1 Uncharacterized protein, DUF1810 family [Spirosoma fluviale]